MNRTKILGNTVTVLACLLMLSVSKVWADGICRADLDFSGDVYPGDAMIMLAEWGREDCAPNGPAPVPKTGNTTDDTIGEDGYYQKGVAWPNPRFKDNGNGTVTDKLTGLIWLKDANCFGLRNWYDALSDCNGLNSGECELNDGSIAGDWRLPNRFELESLLDMGSYDPALSDTAGTGKWSQGDPFNNVQSYEFIGYWSSNTIYYDDYWGDAWQVGMYHGLVSGYNKTYDVFYVWPVRGGSGDIPGLVSYWKFDEGSGTIAHDSADANHGTIHGAQWTIGKINGALLFDGIDDYVAVPQNQSLDIADSVTVEAWVYPQAFAPWYDANAIFVRWYDAIGDDKGIALVIIDWGWGIVLRFAVIQNDYFLDVPYSFQTNTWYHIAATWNGSISRAYVNGEEIGNRTTSGAFTNQNINLGIGCTWMGELQGNYFNGKLDEVTFYKRVLSEEEIQQHYQNGL